jgi:hypothetical protein
MRSLIHASSRRRPNPRGDGSFDHSGMQPLLAAVASGGVRALQDLGDELSSYRHALYALDPDELGPDEALAYWLNLYNAEMLELPREAYAAGHDSLLRVPGVFDRPRALVAGERLSLDDIEHGKVRRFKDPRVHAALVCGSVSCPSLRAEPYAGPRLQAQLADQMRSFLAAGGAVPDEERGELRLSRIFLWYGSDFVRPRMMPAWLPVSRRAVAGSLRLWLSEQAAAWMEGTRPTIRFQPYDWSLGCAVEQVSASVPIPVPPSS